MTTNFAPDQRVPAAPRVRAATRGTLLHSVSLTALMAGAGAVAATTAQAGSFRTIGQSVASGAGASAAASANAAATQAARQASLGALNVAAAASRFRTLSQALAGMAYTGPAIADGVAPGGLQQAPGVAGSASSTLWSGASTTLTQTLANGVTDVTVSQTSPVASLQWQTFNIGAKTKLIFNQSAGGTLASSWVVINTVNDPSANPSTILGDISAPGKVFVLNPNGILFGAGSQLNVGSLVASTASIAKAQLTTDTNGLINGFSLYGTASTAGTITPTFTGATATGSILVDAGATITTAAPTGTQAGGYVMLLADVVQNAGLIATPKGQTILAAGTDFAIQPGYSVSNPTATVIGSDIAVYNKVKGTALGTLGTATNTGIIVADQGDVTMVGHQVVQDGALLATTTVNTRGTVHLLTDASDTTATVVLGPDSVTEVLPEDNGQTALNSQRQANLSASVTDNAARLTPIGTVLNDYDTLADTLGESRIEISTGGSVIMQGGALALAQGGQMAVAAGRSIAIDSGATIDVSGTNATLPASANSLLITDIVPYTTSDSAGNRASGVQAQNAYIDLRTLIEIASGAYAGNIYTGGGLLQVSGNLGLVPHGINEWSSIAGQVTLQSATKVGSALVGGTVSVAAGATINLTGGTVTYDAGLVPQTYLQATDGRIFNVNEAPGDLVYTGVYTGVVEAHPRWHITDTFINPLLTPAEIDEPSYVIGRDAGNLTVSAASGAIDGMVDAGVTTGAAQTGARPTGITDPFLLAQSVAPLAGSLNAGLYEGGSQYGTIVGTLFNTNILISGPGQTPQTLFTALPDSVAGTIAIDSAALSADGLANVTVYTAAGIGVSGQIGVANGGTITLGGEIVDVEAALTAHGGTIALTNLLPSTTGFTGISSTPGAITVAGGVTLDATGTWTNLQRDPTDTSQEGHANGGRITVFGTGPVDLAAGSVLDVSSGGIFSAAGKLTAEAGGSITVSADIVPLDNASIDQPGAVTYAARFVGLASGNAGTLSLSAPGFVLGPQQDVLFNTVLVDPALFGSGFASYVLNGYLGLVVDDDEQIAVTRPVYTFTNGDVTTGAAAAAAYSVTLPQLYTQARGGDSFTQRAGASLTLQSSVDPTVYNGNGGAVLIGTGADISVDPGQSITVAGYGQVSVLGTLTAHGGRITVANTRYEQVATGGAHDIAANYQDGLSVWIGTGAMLDASGQAIIATDGLGRSFGQGQAGGTILLGGLGGADATSQLSTYAQVILRPGAILNASGASATVDVVPSAEPSSLSPASPPTTLAGNGGTIIARSYDGIALDGTMLAAGSGAGAAGGTLIMRLDPESLDTFFGFPAAYFTPSQIVIAQTAMPLQLGAGIAPGQPTAADTLRLASISQQQITAGGFDSLSLYAQDDITFAGSVDLSLGRSLVLSTTILGDTQSAGTVAVTVPYLSLFGYSSDANGGYDVDGPAKLSARPSTAVLTLNTSFIDITNNLTLGGQRVVSTASASSQPAMANAYGFADAAFNSSGDIRFDEDSAPRSEATALSASGNILFDAQQLYPATGATAIVTAGEQPGLKPGLNQLAGGTLTVMRPAGAVPEAPFSVGGTLSLIADQVIQNGIVRAPEGVINLGIARNIGTLTQLTDSVTLGAGSITSVSLDGMSIPYGGTVDGVNYLYDGTPALTFTPLIQIAGATVTVQPGATVDLRGGGTLTGAGFIPGRGGSADVNKTPLLTSASGTIAAGAADPVFAIVPGYQSDYAPVAPGDSGYSTPSQGEQITIRAGEVAGLAAGTYTLLPAYYDLLTGAYRVELTGAPMTAGTATNFGNYTTEAAVTVGTANAGVFASTPTAALITSGAGVRRLSQYNEENYSTFEISQAATFNAPRPLLPEDAKTLVVLINTPATSIPANDQPVSIEPASLLQSAPAGGYGATLEISATAPIEILGAGEAVVPYAYIDSLTGTLAFGDFGLSSAMLDALALPRLVIGGTLTASRTYANQIDLQGLAPDVLVLPEASLTAGNIMLTTIDTGLVRVEGGATLSTLGQPDTAYSVAQGLYFNSDNTNANSGANPVLSLSNTQIAFTPNSLTGQGAAIEVDTGATLQAVALVDGKLQAVGSLDFVAPLGTSVQIGEATLRAASVDVQVADINLGSAQALASFAPILPQGLTLGSDTLNVLAQGATTLTLTANEAVNIIGSVDLNSGNTSLVLNTPAIYGYGVAGATGTIIDPGNVTIQAPSFTWSGIAAQALLQTSTTAVSSAPGGQLAGTVASGGGTLALAGASGLTINAATIDLGYGPSAQIDDQVKLDRLAVGFGTVTLAATSEITANNQSSLSVFATQPNYGQPGTGGNLVLTTPLLTAASGAVLDLTAGGSLSAANGGEAAKATGTISTLGATIDLVATTVAIDTAVALPSGKLSIAAAGDVTAPANSVDLQAGSVIDLSGRAVPLFDQTAYSTGGTLLMAAATGGIGQDQGGLIDVSSPGANAGAIQAVALAGAVDFNGTLSGSATAGHQAGSFTIAAAALPSFDALNATLDAGGITGARNFEAATGDIAVDQTITAHTVTIAADAGNIDVTGLINASGTTPGSIALSAGGTLTLESGAVLDAHATKARVDSTGQEINAENRAHVTLTSAGGEIVLAQGATINVAYPDATNNPQGEIVLNAPRVGSNGVAVTAGSPLTITGAYSIALNAFITYSPTDPLGTVVQDNGTGDTLGSGYSAVSAAGTLGVAQIGLDNQLYMNAVDANGAALATQLAGLAAYGATFHLRPGVLIESTAATGNNLTISGDIDFSQLRYNDPSQFGTIANGKPGSGEPGSVVFRAANNLTVNGSVSDGFALPPDETNGTPLAADVTGWKYLALSDAGEVTNADLLLPAGAVAVTAKSGTSTQIVLIGTTDIVDLFSTTYDTVRPISLNYTIVINPARLNANVVIPFALTVGQASDPIPAGGWVATAPITRGGVTLFAKGQVIPAGFVFQPNDVLGTGTILPVQVVTGVDAASGTGQTVPAGTPFTIFYDPTISLSQNTGVLPANAFIPGTTAAVFGAVTADGSVVSVKTLNLRPTQDIAGNMVQGYLTPLAPMLTPGTQSWSLDFVAGANLAGANVQAVLPASTLNGSVFASVPAMTDQAPGSILLDDQHYYANAGGVPSLAFSVIRTGTGDLSLVAGGDIDQSSLYGIYTAGTQALLGRGNNPPFEDGRYYQGGDYLLPGKSNEAASLLISSTYQAYYPNGGGDVLFAAQGDVTGDVYASTNNGATGTGTPASDAIGNWLWRQGSTQLGQPTAWWINFGTLAAPLNDGALAGDPVQMVGFQGIGALGGGNVTVTIGGDAGQMTNRDEATGGTAAGNQRGEGLIIAVGSTGRILAGTTIPKITGGGDISVTIGGTLNPIDAAAYDIGATPGNQSAESPAVNGDIIDVRGNVSVTAGAIGRIDPVYSASATVLGDPRALDPFASEDGVPNGGIEVAPGDGTVSIATLRDLVLAGAADPGRVTQQNLTDLSAYHHALGKADNTGGNSGFTLWQAGTSISLFSDGGNVTPTTVPNQELSSLTYANDTPTDYRSVYPPSLLVTAATGNIVYGQYGVTPSILNAKGTLGSNGDPVVFSLETMPAANGQVSFLAGQSIFANFYAIDLSGADPAGLSRPLDPAFTSDINSASAVTNILTGVGTNKSTSALFALEADTPTTNLHADDPTPARFYAAGGDVLDFQTGETLSFVTSSTGQVAATWYIAAKPVWILASQDIVSTGTQPAADPGDALFAIQENQSEVISFGTAYEYSSGNLFLNNSPQSISVMSAGRDILGAYTYVGGPGLLEVQAGRNLYQASAVNSAGSGQLLSFGSIKSLGNNLIAGSPIDLSGGAGISVLAGVGAAGPDYTAFAELYFNPANQADLSIPLTAAANKGKVQAVYATQLQAWLAANYRYTGNAADALQAFLALPAIDQNVFVRQIFFTELQASGTQEANPASPFYKSYARGRLAIDTLLPSTGTEITPGVPVGYSGAVTMYSGPVLTNSGAASHSLTTLSGATATFDGGIATLFGGSVQVLAPGGQSTFGVPGGPAPGNNSGIVTYGSGDIDIYSLGNVLLGKSRIFTTAGGNILIWSSDGDINAGIGAKTTQVFDPPLLVYDALGDITETPPSVSTGAGIATLQPLPEVPAGDVTLIAPLGTIDAGEAGIRVSGNLTLAAAQIANTAGISVKGSTAGAPTVTVASLGAVEAAGAAAGAAASTAQSQAQRGGDDREAASVLDVEVISIGGSYDEEKKKRRL